MRWWRGWCGRFASGRGLRCLHVPVQCQAVLGMYGKRIRYHYSGNAAGSTLRLNLGCLLAERLGIQLRRVGSGQRLTFAAGEARLSAWMADNALSPGSRLIASGWRNSG
jgi:hypothetical protein